MLGYLLNHLFWFQLETLSAHSKIHRDPDVRKVHCEEQGCDFSCFMKNTLRRHHRDVHDDKAEPRFKCSKCNEGFKVFSSFKKHQMTVCDAPNRPHACEFCHAKFKLKQSLMLHYHDIHHTSKVVAREKVYPGLPVPEWACKKYSKRKSAIAARRKIKKSKKNGRK